MIIFRYLNKQVIITLLAITSVLLLVVIGGRFIKYLAEAAAGEISADILLTIMAYRIPGFLQLILPLALFLAILMAYGRLYMENEMVVLSACGVSNTRILLITLCPTLVIAIIVGMLSLYISPSGIYQFEKLVKTDKTALDFGALNPGRFQELGATNKINIYVEKVDNENNQLTNVFIIDQGQTKNQYDEIVGTQVIMIAPSGTFKVDKETSSKYAVLNNGYRYEGVQGQKEYRVTRFETFAMKIEQQSIVTEIKKRDAMPTTSLLASNHLKDKAALQWRISLPILVFVVVLFAIPLSRVNPRQGRFIRMLPAILLYLVYIALLQFGRNFIEDGKVPHAVGLWWVHGLFLSIAFGLLFAPTLRRR